MLKFIPLEESLLNDMYELNEEYFSWISSKIEELYSLNLISIIGQSIKEYARNSLNDLTVFSPPNGIYYIIQINKKTIGMGALRNVKDKFCEIKRMYIKPEYRGRGIGTKLIHKLLEKVIDFNYSIVRLDTGIFMNGAQRVYHSAGFTEREEYTESEVPEQLKPHWLFMEKKIQLL